MSEVRPADAPGSAAAPPASSVGEALRKGREAAGLDLDDVSAQLKLSPRQIRALEEERYEDLPGRAFLRGFVRNYARLLQLNADELVAHLEAPSVAPLFGSNIAPTRGELPQHGSSRAWPVWALPAILLAVIAAGAYLEWKKTEVSATPPATETPAPVTAPAETAHAPPADSAPVPPPDSAQAPAPSPPANPTSAREAPAVSPAPAVTLPEGAAAPAGEARPAAAGEVDLHFRDRSWVEIRDRSGQVLLSRVNAPGSRETIKGAPPLSLTIGNAHEVDLVYNGKRVDLGPHSIKNVARLMLR